MTVHGHGSDDTLEQLAADLARHDPRFTRRFSAAQGLLGRAVPHGTGPLPARSCCPVPPRYCWPGPGCTSRC
jgi:hypothetical protein